MCLRFLLYLTWSLSFLVLVQAADYTASDEVKRIVWESSLSGFAERDYSVAVEELITAYEIASSRTLVPGERGRAGLKVYTHSGVGLATPVALVEAVIVALEKRGFQRKDLFIVDQREDLLRQSGFVTLGKRGQEGLFRGVPVYALATERFYDPEWFYDSNLPSRQKLAEAARQGVLGTGQRGEDRKSFLPAPLILETDFWINLPMVSDSQTLMLSGALVNGTLYGISNNRRFFDQPASAAVAVAEIGGIPELKEPWVFTLMTLERYQYMGGPDFNARYSKSEKRLWLSANPVALDSLIFKRINKLRGKVGFPVFETDPAYFRYSSAIGFGPSAIEELELVKVK